MPHVLSVAFLSACALGMSWLFYVVCRDRRTSRQREEWLEHLRTLLSRYDSMRYHLANPTSAEEALGELEKFEQYLSTAKGVEGNVPLAHMPASAILLELRRAILEELQRAKRFDAEQAPVVVTARDRVKR